MALTLLRHATLAQKHQGHYSGWTDLDIDPALFDAKEVSILKLQKFDIVYSSDLVRCQQTLEMMGIDEYITDERLREVRFKEEIEGKSFKEIEKLPSYCSYYMENIERWHEYICDEHPREFEARIKSFLDAIPKDKEILICSHAGTIQKMMVFLGYAKSQIAYLESIRVDNIN